jgi:hypothetical protein
MSWKYAIATVNLSRWTGLHGLFGEVLIDIPLLSF